MTLAARMEDFEVTLEHMLMDVFVSLPCSFLFDITRAAKYISPEFISAFRHNPPYQLELRLKHMLLSLSTLFFVSWQKTKALILCLNSSPVTGRQLIAYWDSDII